MSALDLRKDPGLLFDEAATVPLTGGNKIIRITGVAESDSKSLSKFLSSIDDSVFLIAEAGELRGRSALKQLFEETKYVASISCYQDRDQDIRRIIQNFCEQQHLNEINKIGYLFRTMLHYY